jgi:pimeloyl-ACP methyl ester carboxylesterase
MPLLIAPLMLAAATPALAPAEITAPGPLSELKGTLQPAGKPGAPVVLIIPGSGPTDRDGNNPMGVKAASYRLLAEGLAAQGVTSVRIDKRGMFGSKSAIADANSVTIPDYVADTAAWVAATRKATGARCVWLLGHSEGALVALASVNTKPDGICGAILVAAAGRPLGEVLRAQLHANPGNGPLLPAADAAIDSLTAGKPVDAAKVPAPLLPLFHPAVQGFLMSAFALDPASLAAKAKRPIAIVQGTRDIQVPVSEAQRLKDARPDARLFLLSDVNHVLKQVTSDDRAAQMKTYTEVGLPLAPGVVEAVASAIRGR